jgi:hypothetical protein
MHFGVSRSRLALHLNAGYNSMLCKSISAEPLAPIFGGFFYSGIQTVLSCVDGSRVAMIDFQVEVGTKLLSDIRLQNAAHRK